MAGAGVGTKHSGVVTTCGVTSIKENPGDARIPISAAKLADEEMDDHLESSGATTFFTLVRYNMPELLDDYMREKYEKTEASKMLKRGVISKDEKISKKKKILSSINSSLSFSSNSEASDGKEEETPEEIIFMLFGPRVWEHKGKIDLLGLHTYLEVFRQCLDAEHLHRACFKRGCAVPDHSPQQAMGSARPGGSCTGSCWRS